MPSAPTIPVAEVEQWTRTTLVLASARPHAHPGTDVTLDALFTGPDGATLALPGFWDGGNTWKVRFAPTQVGRWTYRITCSDPADRGLHGVTGTLRCRPYTGSLAIYRHGFLRVADDRRHFAHADGTPFFWLGDTHWQMPDCERLDACNCPGCGCGSQFRHLAADRLRKGFTVYQTYPDAAMNDAGGNPRRARWWTEPYAHLAPQPFRDFFDPMMDYLADHGLVIALGAGVHHLSSRMGRDALVRFTRHLVARYAAYPVVWFTGQEVDIEQDTPHSLEHWRAAAETIAQGDGYHHPLSAHMDSTGEPKTFADRPWHSWFATQGGHKPRGIRSAAHYRSYWDYEPARPFVETEAMYEHVSCEQQPATTRDTRVAAWNALLCGAAGYSYGAAGVWALKWAPEQPGWDSYNGKIPWYEGMALPGSTQMAHMRRFFEELPWFRLVPRWHDPAWGAFQVPDQTALATDGDAVWVAYFFHDGTATGELRNLDSHGSYQAQWFDPRTGARQRIAAAVTPGAQRYAIPSKPDHQDWVLLLTRRQ